MFYTSAPTANELASQRQAWTYTEWLSNIADWHIIHIPVYNIHKRKQHCSLNDSFFLLVFSRTEKSKHNCEMAKRKRYVIVINLIYGNLKTDED